MSPVRDRVQAVPTWAWATVAVVLWAGVALYMVVFGAHWFLDTRVYRGAGNSLLHGGRPYHSLFTQYHLPFTYPPFALLVLSVLSLAPLRLTEALWWACNAAALVGVVYLAARSAFGVHGRRALAISAAAAAVAGLAFEPIRSNMDFGQINVALMLLIVCDLTVAQRRGRGVLVGLAAAIKVTPLVFIIGFVVDRDWRAVVRSLGTFVTVTAVAWLVLPSDSRHFWTNQLFDTKRVGSVTYASNQSFNALVHRSPFPHGAATYLWPLLVVITVSAGTVLCAHLTASEHRLDAVFVLALTELLISPISWTHHWSWIVLLPIVLIERWRDGPVLRALLILLGLIAILAPYWWNVTGPLGHLTEDALALAGAAVLFGWTIQALRQGPQGLFPSRKGAQEPHLRRSGVSLQ